MEFTNAWFQAVRPVWEQLLPSFRPARILEIGTPEKAKTLVLQRHWAIGRR